MEVLILENYERAPEWIDLDPRLRQDILALKRLAAPENPAVTRCRASESMTDFYLLVDASVQGFGLGLWYHEGLRYESEKCSTQWKTRPTNGRREPILL